MAQLFDNVIVDAEKLREYCLSDSHPRGRHKARVFRSRLGLTADNAEMLRQALLDAARRRSQDVRPTESDRYGRRYVLDFEMSTPAGRAVVRSSWIVPAGQNVLRFVTCYIR